MSDNTAGDGNSLDDLRTAKVGYKNPPKHTRFQKGRSGNPRGRPKGHLNLKTDLSNELAERVKLSQDGRQVRLTKQQALVKSLVARAIKGDARATNVLLPLILKVLEIAPVDEADNATLSQSDEQILQDFIASLGKNNGERK